MKDYEKDLHVRGFRVYCDIYTVFGKRTSLCQHDLGGCSDCIYVSFSPLPYQDVLLHRHLQFLIHPSDCLSWYCGRKCAFWGW